MATRFLFDDGRDGAKDDDAISELLGTKTGATDHAKLKRIMMNVVKGELTENQQKMIIMYYFRNMKLHEIAEETGVSVQAVSATLARARNRIYRVLKYYFD